MASAQVSVLARRSAVPSRAPTAASRVQELKTRKNPRTPKLRNNKDRPSFSYMKHGIGRLTASSSSSNGTSSTKTSTTKLTQVSHKAPMRWIPLLQNSKIEKAGAAVAAMSNYGAGLLPGDVNQVEINVKSHAKLGVLTQGSNRIYKQKAQQSYHNNNVPSTSSASVAAAKSTLKAKVEANGLLVVAPDPTVPFANSNFHQQQEFVIHPISSLIAIDWFSSGRYANGERWLASKICSETKLRFSSSTIVNDDDEGDEDLLVWDSTTIGNTSSSSSNDGRRQQRRTNNMNPFGFDMGQQSFNVYASMLLYGTESMPVVQRLQELQYQLAAPYTRLRQQLPQQQQSITTTTTTSIQTDDDGLVVQDIEMLLGTTGRVLLGVNQLQVSSSLAAEAFDDTTIASPPLYMARWAATSNEDLYRMLHYSLKPLGPRFGLEFYQDRIRATSSGRGPTLPQEDDKAVVGPVVVSSIEIPKQEVIKQEGSALEQTNNATTSHNAAVSSWKAYMLADSALPTGSFAHSAGLEAASQLGLLNDHDDDCQNSISNNNNNNNKESHVQSFIEASTRSTLQQATPWILAGHEIMATAANQRQRRMQKDHGTPSSSSLSMSQVELEEWEQLDRQVQAVMVCSAPACRASIDQGRNLLRVAIPWLQEEEEKEKHHDYVDGEGTSNNRNTGAHILEAIQESIKMLSHSNSGGSSPDNNGNNSVGHMAPLFGMLTGALGLTTKEACNLLGYCVARDIVSAAVRLNLIGPLKSVAMLSKAQAAAQEGIQNGKLSSSSSLGTSRNLATTRTDEKEEDEKVKNLLWTNPLAGGCSPVIDAIHPCHDILAVRLFRT